MKVKQLIDVLKEMPQDSEVFLYENTDWSYEGIEILGAKMLPIQVGEEFCNGSKCGLCNNGEDYCHIDLDGIFPIIDSRVVLDIGYEEYEIKELGDD